MKYSLLVSLLACASFSLQAQITETATDAVKNMGLGWNLGNTLDANSGSGKDLTAASYWGQQDLSSETCWGQSAATPELIKMMKDAGFGAIRVPVTWYNHMDKDGKVDEAWMKRVHEVVDYVIDNGLYCLVNVHHDTGADSDSFAHWIHADAQNYKDNKDKFELLWTQIAEEFKDYNEKLLFEGYNEMLDGSSTWNAPKNSASYKDIDSYAQSFVDAVRATGGNNETRNLIVNTYAAANSEAPVKNLTLPKDNAKDHTIVEVHAYPNFFEWSNPSKLRTIAQVKSDVDYIIKTLNTNVIAKGIPAIIGEWGSFGVDNGPGKTDYDLRKDMFFEFCEYFVKQAKAKDIATFYWMGLTDGRYRGIPAFNQADLAECLAKAFHGSSFVGNFPEPEAAGSNVTIFEGNKMLEWGTGTLQIEADYFKAIGTSGQMTVSYQLDFEDYDDIQFFYGDWDKVNKVSVIVDEDQTFEMDFAPSGHYGIASGDEKTTVFTFSPDVYTLLTQKGMIIQGHGVRILKVTVTDPNAAGVENISVQQSKGAIYNLSGQRVKTMGKGFYIKQGEKTFVK